MLVVNRNTFRKAVQPQKVEQSRNEERHHQRNTGERTCALFNASGLIAKSETNGIQKYAASDPRIPNFYLRKKGCRQTPTRRADRFSFHAVIHRFGDRGPEHRHLHIAEEINKIRTQTPG